MGVLRKLPESLISKIAAGEVIERPFSVVKELVENSLDAGARQIDVEIEEGGRRKITILDDGIGMTPEEALLALERHATSKLASEEDLFNIKTLGFRGEALPSIAAVSWMSLETRKEGSDTAIRLDIEGGRIVKNMASALPKGTRISIQNLFFNTPARLKFLKSKETEFSHIANWMEAIALSHPQVGFTLRHNGKTEIRTPVSQSSDGSTKLRERVKDILGDVVEFLHPVSNQRGPFEISGFISDRRAYSPTAKSLYFFVNDRIVRDRTLQHAVLSAYENLLMKHQYPWVVLSLTVPPDRVDVNVHPTKSEVKFADGRMVHEFVKQSLRDVLEGSLKKGAEDIVKKPEDLFVGASWGLQEDSPSFVRRGAGEVDSNYVSDLPHLTSPYKGEEFLNRSFSENIRVLGQVHGTYLVCETEDKLILIDQHAAHERIGFEKLKKQYEEGGIQKQSLLIPQNFDLRPSQSEILKKYLGDLQAVGLEIEFFGGHTFILRSVPTLLEGTNIPSLVEELIESLQSFEKLTPLEERIHEVLERMACHSQVRAGDKLSNLEIEALLSDMNKTPFSGQCPHGRPSILEISYNEIEKWFRRRI